MMKFTAKMSYTFWKVWNSQVLKPKNKKCSAHFDKLSCHSGLCSSSVSCMHNDCRHNNSLEGNIIRVAVNIIQSGVSFWHTFGRSVVHGPQGTGILYLF